MKKFFVFIVALLIPLGVFAQPEVEWVWTDSATIANSYNLNSVDAGLDDGFVLSTEEFVIGLSNAGEELWRTNFGARNTCVLNGYEYVMNRGSTLYITNMLGIPRDSIEIPFSGPTREATYERVVRLASRVFALYDYMDHDIDRWGDTYNYRRLIGQQEIAGDGSALPYEHIGNAPLWAMGMAIAAMQLVGGNTVFSIETNSQDVFRLFSVGESSWNLWGNRGQHLDAYWRGVRLIPNNNNEVVVASIADGAGNPDESRTVNIQKYSSTGEEMWSHDLISTTTQYFKLLAADQRNWASGTLALTSRQIGLFHDDLFLIGTNENGEIEWTERQPLESNLEVRKAVFDNQGRVIVVGVLQTDSGDVLQATAYQPSGNIPWQQPVIPETFTLFNSYPNPFNASTEISFFLPYAALATLKVYDVLGREVAVLADGWTEAGTHRFTFDGSGLASGVYIYRLESGGYSRGGFSQSRKMVLMK